MKVVCLINTRNHGQFIDECVQSCLRQEVPLDCAYEVHAVDAGSTDGTLEKLRRYGSSVTVYARDNIGQSGAFNLCIDIDADVFMFCDGDDRLHPGRLAKIVEQFKMHPDVVMVGNSINEVDLDGRQIRKVYVEPDQYLDANGEDAERLYGARCLMGTSRLAVRNSAFKKILPIEHSILFEADEYIFNLLPAFGRVCILNMALTDYRLHGANNYQNSKPSLERTRRYREVHQQLLQCVFEVRKKYNLTGRYFDLCEEGLRDLCQRTASLEEALTSRVRAVRIIIKEPKTLGMARASMVKRLFYAIIIFPIGLLPTLTAYYAIQSLKKKILIVPREISDARLL